MTPDAAASGKGRPGKARRSGIKRPTRSAGPERKRSRGRRLGRLGAGEAIALVAAILLFVLMFLDWYGTKATTSGEPLGGVTGTGGGSAWDTLEVIPLFLMLAIVVAVGAAILRLAKSDWKPAIPPSAAVCVLGILASVLILIRIISPPAPAGAFSALTLELTTRLPIFLALAAALGVAYGGWRAMATEGTSFAAIGKKLESPKRPGRPKPAAKSKAAERPKP